MALILDGTSGLFGNVTGFLYIKIVSSATAAATIVRGFVTIEA
jgi:hypothetical protein